MSKVNLTSNIVVTRRRRAHSARALGRPGPGRGSFDAAAAPRSRPRRAGTHTHVYTRASGTHSRVSAQRRRRTPSSASTIFTSQLNQRRTLHAGVRRRIERSLNTGRSHGPRCRRVGGDPSPRGSGRRHSPGEAFISCAVRSAKRSAAAARVGRRASPTTISQRCGTVPRRECGRAPVHARWLRTFVPAECVSV